MLTLSNAYVAGGQRKLMADAQVAQAAGKSFSWHRSVCNSVRARMLDKLPTLLNKLCARVCVCARLLLLMESL